eukprot:scaffold1384_cov256-Pinguiococcus_pyrenoidosus.AAC.8
MLLSRRVLVMLSLLVNGASAFRVRARAAPLSRYATRAQLADRNDAGANATLDAYHWRFRR